MGDTGPVHPTNLLGYAGIAAGFGIGYLLNGMFIKLSDRIGGLVDTAFSGTSRGSTGPGSGVKWTEWIAWLVSVAIWGGVALWGYSRWRGSSGFGNGVMMGIGLGGVIEEVFHVPGGV